VSVLIVKNVTSEGPGTIEDHLRSANIPFTLIDLEQGSPLPAVHDYSHLIILGGPMAVYEMDRTPYLSAEARFIEQAVKASKHMAGYLPGRPATRPCARRSCLSRQAEGDRMV